MSLRTHVTCVKALVLRYIGAFHGNKVAPTALGRIVQTNLSFSCPNWRFLHKDRALGQVTLLKAALLFEEMSIVSHLSDIIGSITHFDHLFDKTRLVQLDWALSFKVDRSERCGLKSRTLCVQRVDI